MDQVHLKDVGFSDGHGKGVRVRVTGFVDVENQLRPISGMGIERSGGLIVKNGCVEEVIPQSATEHTCKIAGLGHFVSWKRQEDLTLRTCYFTYTYDCASPGAAGGAIRFEGGRLSLSVCHFTETRSGNNWGAAVFAKATGFHMADCRVDNIHAEYSVIHVQKGETFGDLGQVKLERTHFTNISITTKTDKSGDIQCGGAGLAIRYSLDVELVNCNFKTCKFLHTQNKCAGALMFEKLNTSATFQRCFLKGCTFTECNGKTGCIYINDVVSDLAIENCEIKSSGGTNSGHPYSVYLRAQSVSMTTLKMKTMDGGNGQIWLGGVSQPITFASCEFSQWRTGRLFSTDSTGLDLTLTRCTFTNVAVNGQSLLQDTSKLTVTDCQFTSVSADRSLVSVRSGECSITGNGKGFETITVQGSQILVFSGDVTVTLTKLSFKSSQAIAGALLVETTAETKITGLVFSGLTVTSEGVPPLVKVAEGSYLTQFDSCTFEQCTYTNAALIRLEVQLPPQRPMANCVFRGCNCNWAFVKCTKPDLRLQQCTFEQLTNVRYPLVSVDGDGGTLEVKGTSFSNVAFGQADNQDVIEVLNNGPREVYIEGMTVSGLTANSLLSCPVGQIATVYHSEFTCTVTTLFKMKGQANWTLNDCNFSSCEGQLIQMSNPSIDFFSCNFQDCHSQSPLIEILTTGTTPSIYLSNCCFQHEATSGTDIKGPATVNVNAEPPLCFDRSREDAIDFNGANPFEAIENVKKIFNCNDCSQQPAPVDPTSDEVPTSDEALTFTDDVSSIDPSDSLAPPTGGDAESEKGGLSTGAIAGIVIAILICLALIILLVLLLLRRKKEKSEEPDDGEMTEENVTETTSASFASYEAGNNEFTEDNPIFVNDQDVQSEFNAFEEHWV